MVTDYGFRILFHSVSNKLLNGFLFKDIDLQNLQKSVEASRQAEPLFHDGHEQVDAQGNPDLGLDGVGRSAVESLDPQVLLDPTKEQLDPPSQLEDVRHGFCWDGKNIGQKHKPLFCFGFYVRDPAQRFRVGFS